MRRPAAATDGGRALLRRGDATGRGDAAGARKWRPEEACTAVAWHSKSTHGIAGEVRGRARDEGRCGQRSFISSCSCTAGIMVSRVLAAVSSRAKGSSFASRAVSPPVGGLFVTCDTITTMLLPERPRAPRTGFVTV